MLTDRDPPTIRRIRDRGKTAVKKMILPLPRVALHVGVNLAGVVGEKPKLGELMFTQVTVKGNAPQAR